ncbi:Cobalt import ATP-binding protein CbiO [Phaeobacter sp. CECT 5382]|nr:Cobalt import ATP-binding protein CbiO [Phaeobacter sp. CECT 5382]
MFLIASGLSIIFGVTRIVNFAHGSFYMVGAYLAYSLVTTLNLGVFGLWFSVLAAALFAVSLHFMMGIGGMVSFGHAAYFGVGAYGAALAVKVLGLGMLPALALAPVAAAAVALFFGWFCVRLSGVYLAMLTMAAAQILWGVTFQWQDFTGGDDGILGVWPAQWARSDQAYFYVAIVLCIGDTWFLHRVAHSPFGYTLRGIRDSKIWRMGGGRTFQITETFQSMTVLENIQMALISHHRRSLDLFARATRLYLQEVEELLALVSMQEHAARSCSELAYGDLERLELAIALAHGPDLLLMDEPTVGMASAERLALMALTAKIVASGKVSAAFSERDMDVVFAHSHRTLVLNRGELIAEGISAEIRADPLVQEVHLGGGSVFEAKQEASYA